MISNVAVASLFSVAFGAAGLYLCWRLLVDRHDLIQSVGHVLHIAMCASMALMPWTVWYAIPTHMQLAIFLAATAFFLALGLVALLRAAPRSIGVRQFWQQLAHAVMMLAMVWMIAAMPMGSATHAPSGSSMGHAGHDSNMLGVFDTLTGIALVGGLIITTALYLAELTAEPEEHVSHRAGLLAHSAMSLGMAGMGWLMLSG